MSILLGIGIVDQSAVAINTLNIAVFMNGSLKGLLGDHEGNIQTMDTPNCLARDK